jgi:hypothetical protein
MVRTYIMYEKENLKRRDHLGKLGFGGRMVLTCIIKRTGRENVMHSDSMCIV